MSVSNAKDSPDDVMYDPDEKLSSKENEPAVCGDVSHRIVSLLTHRGRIKICSSPEESRQDDS